jgi:tetratricopeptide (TPR) repeat protein
VAARRDPDSADLQNYLGYANRKQRQFDAAFRHYKRALELDPRHRGAHEYIGEAYLETNDLAGAERHLAALRGICLLPCEELTDLEKAVAQYKAKR